MGMEGVSVQAELRKSVNLARAVRTVAKQACTWPKQKGYRGQVAETQSTKERVRLTELTQARFAHALESLQDFADNSDAEVAAASVAIRCEFLPVEVSDDEPW